MNRNYVSLNPAWAAYVGSGASTGKIKMNFVAQVPGVEKHINDNQPDLCNSLAEAMLAKAKSDNTSQYLSSASLSNVNQQKVKPVRLAD